MSLIHLLLVILIVLVWGFNFVVIKIGLQGVPPFFLVFLRFFLTSVPAIFFIKKPEVPFRWVLTYGLILFALQFSLLFWSMAEGLSSGLASILLQLQAFFTVLFAFFFFREKPNRWQIVGGAISFSGIGLVGMNLGGELLLQLLSLRLPLRLFGDLETFFLRKWAR